MQARTPAGTIAALLTAAALVAAGSRAARADDTASGPPRPALRGADLNLTLWGVSGLNTAPGAYVAQTSVIIEPRYNLGRAHFPGRWVEPLWVGMRLLLETEFAGNDPALRSARFYSPTQLRDTPEQVAIAQAQTGGAATPWGNVEGAKRRLWISDLWFSAFHARLYTIPWLGIDLQAGARVVVPASLESRISTLRAAPSLYLGLEKQLWRFTLSYGVRGIKYFYGSKVAPIEPAPGTVLLNGQAIEPLHLGTTAVLNPNFAFVHAFTITVDLFWRLSLELDYFLFNVTTHSLDDCGVPGVPTADVCRDGLALGDVRRPGRRDSQWFLVELDLHATSWLTLGLGVSTFQPVRRPDGSLAQPFGTVNRNNYTTVYLSLSLNAESLASTVRARRTGMAGSASQQYTAPTGR